MSTIAERILNERPITYTSGNPQDLKAVRPADFLSQNHFDRLFPFDWGKFSVSRRFHLLQRYADEWWRLFLKDFIPTLHARKVWKREREELKEDDVVAILDFQNDRGYYPLGRVISLRKSRTDGIPRTAEVLVEGKIISRPVINLIPLVRED